MTAQATTSRTILSREEKAELWRAADTLRGHMDAAEYKHVVLGLIFLKYLSDAFDEYHAELTAQIDEGADPEDRDEYLAEGLFWVPEEARWAQLKNHATNPAIGKMVDDAMLAIERENPSLNAVLPKEYARPSLNKERLGELIRDLSNLKVGGRTAEGRDILGQVYEYFLEKFASAEGKLGGEFYTPASVVKVLVGMLAPYRGRVYDPCCGSGGMFVQSERFVEEHAGRIGDISVYGQESNPTTWRLARMNLAIRGIEADLGKQNADTFHNDLHPNLKADYILANPPFNISNWGGERVREDKRWQYGVPPVGNANYAWLQHMVSKLAPNGTAGVVLANGSLSTNTSGEGKIREAMVEADLVDCIVSLPGQLFLSTQIPVSLWFLARNKTNGFGQEGKPLRDRSGEILFVDARELGFMEDRTHRLLSDEDIAKITDTYHAWRGDSDTKYADVPGFCKSASLEEVQKQGSVLTPGRYVGVSSINTQNEDNSHRLVALFEEWRHQHAESHRLAEQVSRVIAGLSKEESDESR